MQKIVGYITLFIPFVGLISGGVTVGAHMVNKALFEMAGKKCPGQEASEKKVEPEQDKQEKKEELQEEE